MRTALVSFALLVGLVGPLNEAGAQSTCDSKCQGNSACLAKCGNAPKRSPQAKARQAPPAAPSSPANRAWRERAFTTEGGAGGY